MDLSQTCRLWRIPLRGIDPGDNYLISMDVISQIPTDPELEWLIAYREFRETRELSQHQIDRMREESDRTGRPPMLPRMLLPPACYAFIKYADNDWGYRSDNWESGAFPLPRPPQIREAARQAGDNPAGPYTLAQLLTAITGRVDVTRRPPQPVPDAAWSDWVQNYLVQGLSRLERLG